MRHVVLKRTHGPEEVRKKWEMVFPTLGQGGATDTACLTQLEAPDDRPNEEIRRFARSLPADLGALGR